MAKILNLKGTLVTLDDNGKIPEEVLPDTQEQCEALTNLEIEEILKHFE